MTTPEILALLSESGITLSLAGAELVVRGRSETLDPVLVDLLRNNKALLVEIIRSGRYVNPLNGLASVPPNGIPIDCNAITPEMLPLVKLNAEEIGRIQSTVDGGASNIQDMYPLAPMQEGILFHHLVSSKGDPYLLRSVLRFADRDQLDAFLSALQAVIDRHDTLRTAVLWEGLSEPVQVVWRRAELAVEEVQLDASDGDVGERLAARFDPRTYRLDVRRAPMFHLAIGKGPFSDCWMMVFLFHHLITDHTTLETILDEVQAHLLGRGSQLPVPLPFRNFVAQTRLGVGRVEHEKFFTQMLGDVYEPTIAFAIDNIRGDGSGLAQCHRQLDAELCRRLRGHARAFGVSTASMFHLAWARVLAATSGRSDVVFGTVLLGRMQGEGASRTLGLFLNTLPVRFKLSHTDVEQGVRVAHSLLAQLLRHEHASLALAQRCSRVTAPRPLFNTLLNYRHNAGIPKVSSTRPWSGSGDERTNYPIVCSVDDYGEALGLTAQTVESIDPELICSLMQTTLEGIATVLDNAPRTPVLGFSVLPEAERHKLLVEWNATEPTHAVDRCIHDLIEMQVVKSPNAVAVTYEDHELTYSQVNGRANQLAHYLRGIGVAPESRVVLCLEPSLESVIALLAVLKAGGAYVPLDPGYPIERLQYMLDDSAPIVVLTHRAITGSVRELFHRTSAQLLDLDEDAALWSKAPATDLERCDLTPQHLAYIIYTSGSTGKPKGVMIEHRHVAATLIDLLAVLDLGPADVFPSIASISFDISVLETMLPLVRGAMLVVVNRSGSFDIGTMVQKTLESTFLHGVPSLLESWLAFLDENPTMQYRRLRCILTGGERVPGRLVAALSNRFPNSNVVELYGPTEATIVSSWYPFAPHLDRPEFCIGRKFNSAKMYVLDGQLEPVPIGVSGELYIGGARVARGYWNQPELTSERFIASPFLENDRLYRTGDLVRYLPDGNIEFLGRDDCQVKVRGFRIELGEIEARLAQFPSVRAAVVTVHDDNGYKRLVAYYIPRNGTVSVEELRTHVAGALPEHMVPAAYVQLEELPLTPNGKLDRSMLPSPGVDAYVRRLYEAPVGPIETALARIWREVLGVERVGRHDNFFELGGHSLLVVRTIEAMRRIGMHADITSFFSSSTLAGLSSKAMMTQEVRL